MQVAHLAKYNIILTVFRDENIFLNSVVCHGVIIIVCYLLKYKTFNDLTDIKIS